MLNKLVLGLALLIPTAAAAQITSTTNNVSFTCTGATGPYAFTFPAYDAGSIEVIEVTGSVSVTIPSSSYTITPTNNSFINGGSIVLTNACPGGTTLTIQRATEQTQTAVFTEYMPGLYQTFQSALDKLTMMVQDESQSGGGGGGSGGGGGPVYIEQCGGSGTCTGAIPGTTYTLTYNPTYIVYVTINGVVQAGAGSDAAYSISQNVITFLTSTTAEDVIQVAYTSTGGLAPPYCPLMGCVFTGSVTAIINGITPVNSLPGTDIGAQVNAYVNGHSGTGELWIPTGSYTYSTPIIINQGSGQNMTIHCETRNTILTYTGTGDGIYHTTNGNLNSQLTIDNCKLLNSGSATNGVHEYFGQNLHLTNMVINGFSGSDLLLQGSINGVFIGNDFQFSQYPVELEPDTVHSFASNSNRFIGGTMVYGTKADYWDAGILSSYGSDTSNSVDGVAMEMSANLPIAIIEGTWNDSINNSYLEYINFPNSTGILYAVVVGNTTGSGFGSSSAYTAVDFEFNNNYMITASGHGTYETDSIWAASTKYLHVNNLTDEGAPTYAISFQTTGVIDAPDVGHGQVSWQVGYYRNPPTNGHLWNTESTALSAGEYTYDATGTHFGQLNSTLPYLLGGAPSIPEMPGTSTLGTVVCVKTAATSSTPPIFGICTTAVSGESCTCN